MIETKIPKKHYDIVVVGSGTGNTFIDKQFKDKKIAYIDKGVGSHERFGGTCLNVGCIPTKMFVHAADVADYVNSAHDFNISLSPDNSLLGAKQYLNATANYEQVQTRIFDRIDPLSNGALDYRLNHPNNENVDYFHATARFTGPKEILIETESGPQLITADLFMLAAGSRPYIPPIKGLRELKAQTSDTIMRLANLPASIAIIGSGVVALEFAHILSSFGVEVHLLARSNRLLTKFDEDISKRLLEVAKSRYVVHLNTKIREVVRDEDSKVSLYFSSEETDFTEHHLEVSEVLVAAGRVANSDLLEVEKAGIATHLDQRVQVDEYQRVLGKDGKVIAGMWSVGDLSSADQLKHVANHQMRIAKHNILHPNELQSSHNMPVPAAVFTSPQIATVGMSEAAAKLYAKENSVEVNIGIKQYADIAYGWAMEKESPGDFAKVIVDASNDVIIGAHIIGPQAPTLIQPLIQAMSFGLSASTLARGQYWIHPAMPELVENAILSATKINWKDPD